MKFFMITPEKELILLKFPFYREFVRGKLKWESFLYALNAFEVDLIGRGLEKDDIELLKLMKENFPKGSNYVKYKKGRSNLVLSIPHSAVKIPRGIHHNLNLADPEVKKTLNCGIDLCVPRVTGFYTYRSAARIWTMIPRVVLDVNRLISQADELAVEGGSKDLNASGMIWRATMADAVDKIRPLLTKRYTREEFQTLLRQAYYPYVNYTKSAMHRAKENHGIAIQFELHSQPGNRQCWVESGQYKNAYMMFEKLGRGPTKEGKLPDLIVLNAPPEICSPKITQLVMDVFTNHGLIAEMGHLMPKGVEYAQSQYADPAHGMHSTGIEIVGHNFEPDRTEGKLNYDSRKEKQFKKAFHDCFKALESLRP